MWGVQVNGASNARLIDSNYTGYALLQHGTGTDIVLPYGAITSHYPLIFVRPINGSGIIGGQIRHHEKTAWVSAPTVGYQYAIFVPGHLVSEPSGGWGMRVWNSGGTLVFSSNKTPLMIKTLIRHTHTVVNQPDIILTYPSGTIPWVLLNTCRFPYIQGTNTLQATSYVFESGYVRLRSPVSPIDPWTNYVHVYDMSPTANYIIGDFRV